MSFTKDNYQVFLRISMKPSDDVEEAFGTREEPARIRTVVITRSRGMRMASVQKVDFDSLSGLATSIGSAARGIARELAALEATAHTLQPQWTGEAADAYERARSQWHQQLEQMTSFLEQISTATIASGNALAAVESGFATAI
jgi:6 kDa early secretory antigenic target